jgi:hypothetical protein
MLERPDAYSLVTFASRHGISRSKVYGEIRAGRLTARKIGDRTIILAEDGKTWRESLPKVERAEGYVAGSAILQAANEQGMDTPVRQATGRPRHNDDFR